MRLVALLLSAHATTLERRRGRRSDAADAFTRAMEGAGVIVSAVESRARHRATNLTDVLRASTWARSTGLKTITAKMDLNALTAMPCRTTTEPRILSATYVSSRVANVFCAQPIAGGDCARYDVLLLFDRAAHIAARACSTTPFDGYGLSCGCDGAFARVVQKPSTFPLGPARLMRRRMGDCLPNGDLAALEAAVRNLTRTMGDRWGPAAGERVRGNGPYWPPFLENELQFAPSDALFALLEDAFLGVGVILVAGERRANAARRARAKAFAAWLGRARGHAVDVWSYVLRPLESPLDTIPRGVLSFVECVDGDDGSCDAYACPPEAAPRSYYRVPRDFAAERLPPATVWGHATAYARGGLFDALDDWILRH